MKPSRAALPLAVLAFAAARAVASVTPSVTLTSTWNSNATNADRSSDVIGALQLLLSAEVSAASVTLGHDDSLVFGAEVDAEYWPRFDGLNRLVLGPTAAWRHKFGLGPMAPVFSVEFAVHGISAHDRDREGFDGSVRAAWRQRLDEATQLSVSFEQSRTDARDGVYDRTASEAAIELTRDLDETWRVSGTIRWRDGDVLSYARPPRPELVALSRDHDDNETFRAPFIVYSISARTWSGAVNLTRTLDERTALTFGYEVRSSESGPLSYVNHLVSAAVTRQF